MKTGQRATSVTNLLALSAFSLSVANVATANGATENLAAANVAAQSPNFATRCRKATVARRNAKTIVKAVAKIGLKTSAKAPAKKGGPRFVDGVAILDYDSGGTLSVGDGVSHVQTNDKGWRGSVAALKFSPSRTAPAAASSAAASNTSSTRTGEAATEKRRRGPVPPQFTDADSEGRSISLSQYRGKVVLLDFWATWCPPCRTESPEVAALYQRQKGNGLNIVGISLDNNKTSLLNFAQANNMTWRQVYDGGGWKSAAAKRYKVGSIPFTVVIGRDGKIAAVGARGQQLDMAVQRALATK